MKSKLFVLGAAALLLASCSNELDVPVNQASVEGAPLSINVLANPETKAIPGQVTETALPSNSSIGVTLIKTGADNGLYDGKTYKNVEYKFTNGTSWDIVSGSVLLSATEGTVYGYYPYSASSSDIKAVPISATDNTDYMYAVPATGIKNSNSGASLEMHHALSIVKFKIQQASSNGYTGTGKITNVKLEGATMGASGNMDITNDGAITAAAAPLNYTTELSLTGTNSAELFAVPTGTQSAIKFTVTMDGQNYTATTGDVKLEKGQQYTYTLNMSSAGLTVSQVTVNAWGAEQPIGGGTGEAELTFTSFVEYIDAGFSGTFSILINDVTVFTGAASTTISYSVGDVIRVTYSNDNYDHNYIIVDGTDNWSCTFTATKQHTIKISAGGSNQGQ